MRNFLQTKLSLLFVLLLGGMSVVQATQLNGAYTINPGASATGTNFQNFASAITYLTGSGTRSDGGPSNSSPFGVSGHVVFQVAAGTYTQTTALSIPAITGAGGASTITFDGGTGNASTRIITGNLATTGLVLLNQCKYVNLRNLSIINTSTTNCGGVVIVGSNSNNNGSANTIKNCIVSLPNVPDGSTSSCIMVSASTTGYSASSHRVDSTEIDSNILNRGYYGIYHYGSTTVSANYNRGVKVRGNTLNNTYYMGIYIVYVYNGVDVSGNTITMSLVNTGTQYGIYFTNSQNNAGTVSHQIIGNIIKNASYGIYLLTVNGASTCPTKVYNNMVSNFRSTTNYGIYVTLGSSSYYLQVYHNSVNINNTANSTKYGFYTSGSTNVLCKNNIFAITAGSGTVYPAYFATNPSGNVVNYNVYYNSSSTNLIYRGSALTAANYKTATGGGDSSFNLQPSFFTATDLHLTDACGGKGVDLTSIIPMDIDGGTRSTTPDCGADEFTGAVANNLMVQAMLSPVAPITTGYQDLRVRVKNVGTNTITQFDIAFKNNNGSPVSQTWTGTLNACDTTSVLFTGSFQINLVAINNITLYSGLPNATADGDRSNDTLRTTLYEPLNGNYTIGGTTASFASFTSAAQALISGGISGPVNFTVNAGTYNEQVDLSQTILGISATNTITFDGGNGNSTSRILTNSNVSNGRHTFRIGNSYVRLRNLTIDGASASGAWPVTIINPSTTVAIKDIRITSCRILISNPAGQTTTSSNFTGIATTQNGTGIGQTPIDSLLIDSNTIEAGAMSAYIYGNITYTRNIFIRNNTLNNPYYMGIYAYYMQGLTINYNVIRMHTGYSSSYGLYIYSPSSSSAYRIEIVGNKILHAGAMGMYLYECANSSTNRGLVANNMIGGGFRSTSQSIGMEFYNYSSQGNIDIYNNSVNLDIVTSMPNYHSNVSSALRIFNYYGTTALGQRIRNNNLVVSKAGSKATTFFASGVNNVSQMNFNNCYRPDTTPFVAFGFTNYSGFTNLYGPVGFKGAHGFNQNSMSANPSFVSDTNLNISNGCLRGDTTSLVPLDIYGNTRNSPPNIGAHEFPGGSNDMGVQAIVAPTFPISSGSQDLVVRVSNTGINTVTSFNLSYRLNNGTPVTLNYSGSLSACDTVSMVFTGSQQINLATGFNSIKIYTSVPNGGADSYALNDTLSTQLSTPMVGTYTIGGTNPDFATFNAAKAGMQLRGISGPVIFNVRTGTYNESLDLQPVAGMSSTNTVTFRSQANNRDSVIMLVPNSATAMLKFSGVSNVTFRGITFRNLTTTAGITGIEIGSGSSNDSIIDCRIELAMQSSYGNYTVFNNSIATSGMVFINNIFLGSYYGVYLFGQSTTNPFRNWVFDRNTFSGGYYSPLYYLYYSKNLRFTNNKVLYDGGVTTQYTYWYYADSAYIVNNSFTMAGGSATAANIYLCYQSVQVKLLNNSFRYNNSSTASYFPYIYNNVQTGWEIKNNIFSNFGGGNACYYSSLPSTAAQVDYNQYYSSGAGSLITGAASPTSIAAWRTSCNCDKNSIQYRPAFTSASNLVPLASDSAAWSMNGRGVHTASNLSTDINGANRPTTVADGAPDLGAYEFTPTSLPPVATPVAGPTISGYNNLFYLFGGDTIARIAWDVSTYTTPDVVHLRRYSGKNPMLTGTASNVPNFYDSLYASGTFMYDMDMYYHEPALGTIGNEGNMVMIRKATPTTSPWTQVAFTASVDSTRNYVLSTFQTGTGWHAVTDVTTPLPVKLLSLSAINGKEGIKVNWVTSMENNSSHFIVQRSVDGLHFENIATLKAVGNSNNFISYLHNDVQGKALLVMGTVYYRLEIFDMDGTSETSQVVAVSDKVGNVSVELMPNPFNNQLVLDVKNTGSAVTVEITDLSGKRYHLAEYTAGTTVIDNLEGLPQGIYFARITSAEVSKTVKLLKK